MKITILESKIRGTENNFDFIRIFSAIIVMYSHSYQLTGFLKEEPLRVFSKGYFYFGGLGVIIFFIISGFLITKSFTKSQSLKSYFIARALRIYPGLIAVVFLTVLVIGPILTSETLLTYFSNTETHQYLLNSLSFKIFGLLPGVFSTSQVNIVNGPIWTLPFELFCYILVAFIGIMVTKKIKQAAAILAVLCVLVVCIGIDRWKTLIEFSTYFLCGSIMFMLRSKIVLNRIATGLALFLLLLCIHLELNKHVKDLVVCLALPYIIMNLAFVSGNLNKFAKYGDFSYGLYIWGWIIQQIINQIYPGHSPIFNFIISLPCTVIISWISWHLLEKKCLQYKYRFINNHV